MSSGEVVGVKRCSRCRVEKGLGDFHRDRTTRHGLSASCKVCAKEYAAQWHQKNYEAVAARQRVYQAENRETLAAKQRVYRAENSEKISAKQRVYRAENSEKISSRQQVYWDENRKILTAKQRVYRAENREKCIAQKQAYRAKNLAEITVRRHAWRAKNVNYLREYGRIGYHKRKANDKETVKYIAILQNDPCSYCGKPPRSAIDHITPVSRGGSNEWDNLTAACKRCNSSKHARSLLHFLMDA